MVATVTDLSICNTGAILVGLEQINSLEDDDRVARVCNQIYPITRDALLEKYPWSFAIKQELLAKTTGKPLFDFQFEQQLPTDMLRLLGTDIINKNHRIFNDKLFTNQEVVNIIHLADPGTENYPAFFIRALEFKMAELLAMSVVQDKDFADLYQKKYILAVREARSIDTQSDPSRAISQAEFSLTNVRWSQV